MPVKKKQNKKPVKKTKTNAKSQASAQPKKKKKPSAKKPKMSLRDKWEMRKLEKENNTSKKPIVLRPLESTQSNIPVKEFYNGMIITKDNRYIKIIEVKPSNFMLLSTSDRNLTIDYFRYVLKVCPTNTQFSEITLPGDLSYQIGVVDKNLAIETNESCLLIGNEYRNLLEEAQNYGLKRRFFISFEYENPQKTLFGKDNLDEIANWMDTTAANIKEALKQCGNEIVEVEPKQANNFLAEILYSFYYRSDKKMKSFDEHIFDVLQPYYNTFGTSKTQLAAPEYLAPKSMSFMNNKMIVLNDNCYYSFAYIPSDGYKSIVQAGWLTMFINTYPGVGVTVYLNKVPKEAVITNIRRNINYNEVTQSESSGASASFEDAYRKAESGNYLREGLANGEDFYYLSVLVTVSGATPAEVTYKMRELQKRAKQQDFKLQEATFREEQAFNSTLPLATIDQSLYESSRRNLLLESATSVYPFTTFELTDKDGIYLGTDMSSGSIVTLDIFDSHKYANSNMFICGMSGQGKTYTLLLLAIRMRINHIPVFIIAPEKEHEFERICNALGGQFIQLGAGTNDRINIMEIFKRDESVVDADGATSNKSYLLDKANSLKRFVKLLYPDMSMAEKAYLDAAIMKTYEKFGITQDNESLIDPSNPSKFKKMPILSDLQAELAQISGAEKMVSIIQMMTTGSGKSFNGQTTIDTTNEFTVIGLESMGSEDMLPVGIFMAMDFIWSKIKEDRTKRKALFIDEWWKLGFNPEGAEYSVDIAKTIRGYGGAMILATQQIKDILAVENGKYGEQVLGNCKFKVLMGMEKNDAQNVRRIVGITDNEAAQIVMFRQGEGMLIASDSRVPIKFEGTSVEHKLITTNRIELAEQSENLRRIREEAKLRKMYEEQEKIVALPTDEEPAAEPEEIKEEKPKETVSKYTPSAAARSRRNMSRNQYRNISSLQDTANEDDSIDSIDDDDLLDID